MRKAAASALAALAAACVSAGADRPPSASAGTTFVGRVLESYEVSSFYGDVEMVAYSHRIEPRDGAGTSMIALSHNLECPAAGNPNRLYLLSVARRRLAIAFRGKADPRWLTDLEITGCTPFEQQPYP
jgi:hypothetical protein